MAFRGVLKAAVLVVVDANKAVRTTLNSFISQTENKNDKFCFKTFFFSLPRRKQVSDRMTELWLKNVSNSTSFSIARLFVTELQIAI